MRKPATQPAASAVEHADKSPAIEHAVEKVPAEKAATEKPAAEKAVDEKPATEKAVAEPKVLVRAIASFGGVDGYKSPESKPFEVTRQRAADLRSNLLVEYVDPADEDAAHSYAAKQAAAAVQKRVDNAPRLPESAKSTPLNQHPATLEIADK